MFDLNLSIVTGTFWTWKTYFAVRDAYEAYNNGYVIISNMWLAIPHVRWYVSKDLVPILHEIDVYHTSHITPFDAPDSFLVSHGLQRNTVTPRSFYILADEGAIFFDARNFSKNFADESMTAMLVTPRHLNMQITVVVQDLDLVDKRFKDLCNEIIEFRKMWFGFARVAESQNKKQVLDRNFHGEVDILEKKTHWMYFQHKKDTSQFFGWLYYTKELLGPRAVKRVEDVLSLAEYFRQESTLRDWRDPYIKKLGYFLTEKWKLIKNPLFPSAPVFITHKLSENEWERSGNE